MQNLDIIRLQVGQNPQQNDRLCGIRACLPELLHLSNKEIADRFGVALRQIENLIYGTGLKRTPEQRFAIASRQNSGANNPRYKNGISKNHYHWKKLQRQRYPERVNARQAVHRAVKSGKLKRIPCQHPGCTEPTTFAHHTDYSKPLDVTWLCRPHHAEADKHRLNFPSHPSQAAAA